jgi:hypothetical protein
MALKVIKALWILERNIVDLSKKGSYNLKSSEFDQVCLVTAIQILVILAEGLTVVSGLMEAPLFRGLKSSLLPEEQ